MKLLFDLGHPAHVHLFRNLIESVRRSGGSALAATREKDLTVDLCRRYGIEQVVLSRAYGGGLLAGVGELFRRTVKLLALARRIGPDALLGTSMSIGAVGRIIGRPSFVFGEDDAAVVPLFARFVYPTCTYIVTPDCLAHEDYGKKQLTYPGYHELAYLHPDHFTPDPAVPRAIGLNPEAPYFILRSVALKAHHDVNAAGLSPAVVRRLVDRLAARGTVLITSEDPLPPDLEPYRFPLPPDRFHDVLAFAALVIGDSQTVAAEAAVLGVPNLRCNSFVGRLSYLEELEKKHSLTRGFLPAEVSELMQTVDRWLVDLEQRRDLMRSRRQKMLKQSINVAQCPSGSCSIVPPFHEGPPGRKDLPCAELSALSAAETMTRRRYSGNR